MIDKRIIQKHLPYGSYKLIAEKTGRKIDAVKSYFRTTKSTNSIEIYAAALELSLPIMNKLENLENQAKTALNDKIC